MSDVETILPPKSAVPPNPRATADILARALNDRAAPPRTIEAAGDRASPQEGLALLGTFLAIEDPELRQAILDAVAALANPRA